MIRHESFKLIKARGFCFLFVILLAIDILICSFLCKNNETLGGPDGNIVSCSTFNVGYENALNKIIEDADNNMVGLKFEKISELSFAYRYQKALYDLYSKLKEDRISQDYTIKGWDFLLSYRLGEVLLCIVVVFFSSSIFAVEEKSGMLSLVRLCKYGRLRFAATKVFAASSLCTAFVAIFKAAEFSTVALLSGMQGATAPLKVLQAYLFTPLNINIVTYYLFTVVSAIITVTLLMLICALLSVSTYNSPITVLCGLVFYGAGFFLLKSKYGNPLFSLRMLSCCSAVHKNMSEQRFYAAELFGYPVQYHWLRMIVSGILILFLIAATLLTYNRNDICILRLGTALERFYHKHFLQKRKIWKNGCVKNKISGSRIRRSSLLYWEINKVTARRIMIAAPLAAVCIYIVSCNRLASTIYSEEQYYRSYMMKLEGEWTQEKHDLVLFDLERLDAILQQKSDYEEWFKNQKITTQEYADFLNKYDNAQMLKQAHMRVVNKSDYLQKVSKTRTENAWFVYDTGWISGFSVNSSIVVIVTVVLLFHSVFNCETICGFSSILRCTKYGRNFTAVAKLCATALVSLSFAVISVAAELMAAIKSYEFPAPCAPLYSLEMFGNYSGGLKLYQFVLLIIALKTISAVIVSLAVAALSGIIRNPVATVLIPLVSCFSIDVLRICGLRVFDSCSISNYIAVTPLLLFSFEKSNGYTIFLITTAILLFCVAMLCHIACKNWRKGEVL